MRIASTLALSILLFACNGNDADSPPLQPPAIDFGYELDDVLRLNHLQVRGTHNSYHIAPPDPLDDWNYTHVPLDVQLENQGVRQIELDLHYRSAEQRFAIFHLPGDAESTCAWLTDCLNTVKTWSDAHPGHHPIFIYLEPKDIIDPQADSIRDRYDELDAEILSVFPRNRIFTPDDLQGDFETVAQAIGERGWPTLGQVRGKVLFVFLNSDHSAKGHHFGYTRGNLHLRGRVQFVDSDITDPYAAFLAPSRRDLETIRKAAEKGFISRVLDDANNTATGVTWSTETRLAILNGVHIISTDHPTPHSNPQGYFVDLPGGTPSRCNPVSAPAECTSEAIEAPDRLAVK